MSKRKRDIMDGFDPNKSDSDDDTFEPEVDRPRSRKKSRPAKSGRSSGTRKKTRYRGSDVEDDEELSESEQEDSYGEDDDDDEEEEEMPINEATGRRVRKAVAKRPSYKESSDDSVAGDADDKDELVGDTPKKKPTKIVVLSLNPSSIRKTRGTSATAAPASTRRSTRARTADADDDLVELSNSGKHALPARGSRSISPETAARNSRVTRGGKGPSKAPPLPIEEATQESSSHHNDGEPGEPGELGSTKNDNEEPAEEQDDDAEMMQADAKADEDEDHPMETVEADEEADDDDVRPMGRRTRGARGAGSSDSAAMLPPESEPASTRGRRLARKSRLNKSLQEPSSDFEPGNDSGDDNESLSDKGKSDDGDDDEESTPPRGRGRRTSKGKGRATRKSRQRGDSSKERSPDGDEVAEELDDLRESSPSQNRRRRRRSPSIQERIINERRTRKPVNYAIKVAQEEPEEEEVAPAPTPGRRRGRNGGNAGWDRTLHTSAGPFGGVATSGPGSLFGGPWGTGAAGGVESDSSDDEMGHRSGVAGNVGMTPTSAAPPGLLGGAIQAPNTDGLGGGALGTVAPNVGKVKNQKAYADADPLGVDMNVDFSKVGGLAGHIDQLKEMVQLPLLYPEVFARFHVTPPRGVLFHGPPGTGKTLLARALANSVGIGGKKITFYMRKGADALSKWVGEAEKQLRLLFEEARRTQPSIIFFDEIDGLAPVRSSKQEQIHASIVSTLLALMDGMDGRGQVIVIGATNRPDNIDPALRRPGRFDREFYFPLPDVDARKSIIDIHTQDWGVSDEFKKSLARDAKGYGGADLRALCTEAAMNAIQRTYPQIYSSKEKLIIDPDKINIHLTDFILSKKKIVPSSERASTSGASPLPKAIEPLLRDQFNSVKAILDHVLPRKKKVTALEEAMYEPYDDADNGLGREALSEEFERSRVFRPRLLICGLPGMGHAYLGAAILHHLEGVHVQNFDLATILGDQRSTVEVLVGMFAEAKRRKPSVIFIPNVDTWYATLEGPAMTAFLNMLGSVPSTDPIMVLGTAETEAKGISPDLRRDLFGFSRKNYVQIARTTKENRQEYFSMTISHIQRFPHEFPDPSSRKKRVLEQLEVAPPPPPKVLTKMEEKAEWLRYRQLLNLMKVHLQPIMDQINKKYRIFRTPPIAYSQYQYLFDEQDPNYVLPDIEGGVVRPYEIEKDKDGVQGLRDTATGRFFYNIDIQTIEERLANGYYTKPQEFLRDVVALEKDAKASRDRQRILKASELVTNVEVDVNDIDKLRMPNVPWDEMFETEQRRRAAKLERARKKKAMQSIVDGASREVADSASVAVDADNVQDPPRLHTTSARFRLMSPLSNGNSGGSESRNHASNGTSVPSRPAGEDVEMTDGDTQFESNNSAMQPPSQWPRMEPRSLDLSTRATTGGTTQISQVSAVQPLPLGVSPSALLNDASTTKTSDPSNRSSNWSQVTNTNGIHHEQPSPVENIPDTQPYGLASQATSSDNQWPHSQAQGLAQGLIRAPELSQTSRANASPAATKTSHVPSMANLLNDPLPDEASQSQRQSGASSGSAQVELDEALGADFLDQLTIRTSGCTIEQLEQLHHEMMAEIWRTKNEHNRMKVLDSVTRVFNESIDDIQSMQKVFQPSQ